MEKPTLDLLSAMLEGPFVPPSPDDARRARENVGLTQKQAAALVKTSAPSWCSWETGRRMMSLHIWDLFLLKTHQDWRSFSRDGYPGWRLKKAKERAEAVASEQHDPHDRAKRP